MCLTYTRQAETGACERGPILFEDTDETQLYFFFFIGYKSCSDCVKLVPCLEVMMSWMMLGPIYQGCRHTRFQLYEELPICCLPPFCQFQLQRQHRYSLLQKAGITPISYSERKRTRKECSATIGNKQGQEKHQKTFHFP
ncbi:uncharacterized protein LOC128332022 isoform X2 [Hemicordylus capensis]|uniref:uncharacterized protein LOC128332022 isoform X2 n=1 Tax=Hemicordylus capensis TaxID=884348 RepID=UPI0023031058|nr:uncharacterized protein LOC128332022 isoform X2 [Hemicordylus capensis]